MPFIQTQFYVSPETFALLQSGNLKRWGGVVRDTTGQIVEHLDEYDVGIKDAMKQVGAATVEAVRSNRGKTAVIVGVVAGASIAGGIIAYKANAKNNAEREEVMAKFQDAMDKYFRAIGGGMLNDIVIDQLLDAIEAVKGANMCKGKQGKMLSDYLRVFTDNIEKYTRELCKVNSIQIKPIKAAGRVTSSKRIDAMRGYLLIQKDVIERAA